MARELGSGRPLKAEGSCASTVCAARQQIMMLESLISAYVLSALSLEGARSSERQMIASSWLLMIASLAFSYATPVDQMHPQRRWAPKGPPPCLTTPPQQPASGRSPERSGPRPFFSPTRQRPLRSLFHPAVFVSMVGQALIHLWTMHEAVTMARDTMGPDKLAEVVEFHRRERLREEKEAQTDKAMEEGDYMAAAMAMWSTPFLPNLLNTCVFLVGLLVEAASALADDSAPLASLDALRAWGSPTHPRAQPQRLGGLRRSPEQAAPGRAEVDEASARFVTRSRPRSASPSSSSTTRVARG